MKRPEEKDFLFVYQTVVDDVNGGGHKTSPTANMYITAAHLSEADNIFHEKLRNDKWRHQVILNIIELIKD